MGRREGAEVSASYYTSFETSVALRQAGAPQGPPERSWARTSATGEPYLIEGGTHRGGDRWDDPRAWRLDEILAALDAYGRPSLNTIDGRRVVAIWIDGVPGHYEDGCCDSYVEAAAACWLAVLRAGSEARK